jgi:flavin reductase (DIM6/NTAB) family NADH-FMN oxidoreductase RutF
MSLGWHMVLGFEPALVGCYIWDQNYSFSLIRRSKVCVINIPTFDLVDAVIGVGNTHDTKVDKFEKFGLTPVDASKVDAPGIAECYASFECKLVDGRLIDRYSLFVFEVVKAHVASSRNSARWGLRPDRWPASQVHWVDRRESGRAGAAGARAHPRLRPPTAHEPDHEPDIEGTDA